MLPLPPELRLSVQALLVLGFFVGGFVGVRVLKLGRFDSKFGRTSFAALVGCWPLLGYTLLMALTPPSPPGFWQWWAAGLLILGWIFVPWFFVCVFGYGLSGGAKR